MNGVVAKLIDAAVAEATAPLLVELAEAKVLLQKRDDEVAVYFEEIARLKADNEKLLDTLSEHGDDLDDRDAKIASLTRERDHLQWAAEEHFAELDRVNEDATK